MFAITFRTARLFAGVVSFAQVTDGVFEIVVLSATAQFTTMVYGILNATTGEFCYVSAGHPGPIRLPAGKDPLILESQGFPIGLGDDAYIERSVCLGAGDRLYLYSDGLTEAWNDRDEAFGEARLLKEVLRTRGLPLKESVDALHQAGASWAAPKLQDDVAIVALEIATA